jgi:hypothetical protein
VTFRGSGPFTLVLLALVLALAGPLRAQEDMEDILGGFEEDPEFLADEQDDAEVERFWDLSGSAELSGSYNYRHHSSDTGTNYFGFQRLRLRGNLQLDLDLPYEWAFRAEGWGFFDPAYQFRGRRKYTRAVLDAYEDDAEFGEVWLAGALHDRIDIKLGRQVAIWGRSESLRVLDVLNPLDNREPGRVDLEDLRRPVSMLRVDAYLGDWSLTGIAIPEIRFDHLPQVGSDFFPGGFAPPEIEPDDFEDPEFAGKLTGIFSGWDVTFQGAWFWNDTPRLARNPPIRLVHDRLWMVGSGGNYTRGSWLFKYEVAFLDGLGFASEPGDKSRLDGLLGVEYYGLIDTTITIEGVNRHLFEYDDRQRRAPDFVRQDSQEISARVTRNFWNERLTATFVGILLNWNARDGSIVRFDVDYDIRDALSAGMGILLYQTGDLPPLSQWGRNDRLFFRLKWSF